jgi:hypothetical protein
MGRDADMGMIDMGKTGTATVSRLPGPAGSRICPTVSARWAP